jgi:hypothetical protein
MSGMDDIAAKLRVGRADLEGDAAAETRAHAIVEALQFRRRPVGGDHHLAGAVDERVEHVAEFLLHGLALQELHVVDEQQVDIAQRLLEGDRRLALQRRDKAEHEVLGREIEHLPAGLGEARSARGRLQDVRLAAADAGMDVERIELGRLAGFRLNHRLGGGKGDAIGGPLAEGLEGIARLDRRAGEDVVGGRGTPRLGGGGRRRQARRRGGHDRHGLDLGRHLRRLRLGDGLGPGGGAHENLDARHARLFRLPQGQQTVLVVRHDPRLEEARRQRQIDGAGVGLLEGRPAEPAAEDILAELGTEPLLHTRPLVGIRQHCSHASALPSRADRFRLAQCSRHRRLAGSARHRIRRFTPPTHACTHGNPSAFQLPGVARCRLASSAPSKPCSMLYACRWPAAVATIAALRLRAPERHRK